MGTAVLVRSTGIGATLAVSVRATGIGQVEEFVGGAAARTDPAIPRQEAATRTLAKYISSLLKRCRLTRN